MSEGNEKVRKKKRSERWKRSYMKHRELRREIREAGADILQSYNFNKTKEFIQHGNMTVSSHCMNVARYSIAISEKLRIRCNRKELIRGALLHDYFLYDWHHKDYVSPHKLHGFFHPGIALKNASREYELTTREVDIIKKHMWPLTLVPPLCREAWIVTTADKWCSLMETVHIHKGHGVIKSKLIKKFKEEGNINIDIASIRAEMGDNVEISELLASNYEFVRVEMGDNVEISELLASNYEFARAEMGDKNEEESEEEI